MTKRGLLDRNDNQALTGILQFIYLCKLEVSVEC